MVPWGTALCCTPNGYTSPFSPNDSHFEYRNAVLYFPDGTENSHYLPQRMELIFSDTAMHSDRVAVQRAELPINLLSFYELKGRATGHFDRNM